MAAGGASQGVLWRHSTRSIPILFNSHPTARDPGMQWWWRCVAISARVGLRLLRKHGNVSDADLQSCGHTKDR